VDREDILGTHFRAILIRRISFGRAPALRALAIGFGAIAVIAGATEAHAQTREAFVAGAAAGAGGFWAADCGRSCGLGLSGHVDLGVMLTPRLAALIDVSLLVSSSEPETGSEIGAAAVQLFFGDRFWLKGGLGWGDAGVQGAHDQGLAAFSAFGVEVISNRVGGTVGWPLAHVWDVQLRAERIFWARDATGIVVLIGAHAY
jgi:hypothetical protein